MKILTKKDTVEYVTGIILNGTEFLKLVEKNISGWIDIPLPNTEDGEWSVATEEINIAGDVTIMFNVDCGLPRVFKKPPVTKKKTTAKRKTK
jgi:hypothetical protein